jgi:hypothetical protein
MFVCALSIEKYGTVRYYKVWVSFFNFPLIDRNIDLEFKLEFLLKLMSN